MSTGEREGPRGGPRSPVRLGGMALANGVLVHGPRCWACAVRTEDGRLELASGRKPLRSADVRSPVLRGPARIAEVFALLPVLRRRLPEAKLPFERPTIGAAMVGSALAARSLRRSGLGALGQEVFTALLALGPVALAVRGSPLAAYHGAEHISIGSYEHGEERTREHERCGSHLVGPLLFTTAAGGLLAGRTPAQVRPLARLAAGVGAMAASVELFGWMLANDEHPFARALAKPGEELQRRFVTAEPTPDQLEVANAALAECLRLESAEDGGRVEGEEAPPT